MKLLDLPDEKSDGARLPVQSCLPAARAKGEVQFKLYGEEVVHKTVASSGACGRVYLPLCWVGKRVKIIRVD